ncbi:MAG: thioesterase [Bacteroidetes bacterium GWF2_33_16]|nr:MAG: thioesterase [Bacteroidetes bacterium GWE2_32_14]OFY07059.1 MAG: thioesterase [Bacteroidetes bacterium GWF2_33_16]
MYSSETKIRVRYGETDKMGYVYYGVYPLYYEVGRTELMREFNFPYSKIEEMGIMLPVISLDIKYFKAAKYDDLLTIKTIIKELPSARITFNYEVYNEQKELLNQANTTLVFIDEKSRKPRKAPEELLNTLSPYFRNKK